MNLKDKLDDALLYLDRVGLSAAELNAYSELLADVNRAAGDAKAESAEPMSVAGVIEDRYNCAIEGDSETEFESFRDLQFRIAREIGWIGVSVSAISLLESKGVTHYCLTCGQRIDDGKPCGCGAR